MSDTEILTSIVGEIEQAASAVELAQTPAEYLAALNDLAWWQRKMEQYQKRAEDPRTDAERDLDTWQAEWQETYMSLRSDMR
jgi:hypothetical protein